MSYALHYQEPGKFPAGVLALTVHAAFFAVLMFGVRWQTLPHDAFAVELWDDLPAIEVALEPIPVAPAEPISQLPEVKPVAEAAVKSAAPQEVKADIELREKKIGKTEPTKPTAKEIRARRLADEQLLLQAYAQSLRQSEQARIRAEVSAATAAEVGRYTDMIRNKIRHDMIPPPDVPESLSSEFKVTLLPAGMVLEVVLLKSSGNPAYDIAAERAIYKAQPLPLPADANMQKLFRELRLTIRP